MRTLIVVMLLIFLSQALSYAQKSVDNPVSQANLPMPDVIIDTPEHWKSIPVERQQQIIDKLKQMGLLNPPKSKPFWERVKNPSQLLYLSQKGEEQPEPFPTPLLDALQEALPHFDNEESATATAAILYRYGRVSGYDYLAKRLKENADLNAAFIFALNQDATQMVSVLAILAKKPDVSPEFVAALGDWYNPRVAEALLTEFKKRPDDLNLLEAVASQGLTSAAPQARHLYFSSNKQDIAKIYAGAALVKLDGVPKAKEILDFLLKQVRLGPLPPPTEKDDSLVVASRTNVIRAADELRLRETLPILRSVIEYYIKHGSSVRAGVTYYGTPEDELAVDAAQAIAKIHDTSSAGLTGRLLVRLSNELYPDPILISSASYAVLNLNGSQDIVKSVIGANELSRMLAKRRLKILPNYLMPKSNFALPTRS